MGGVRADAAVCRHRRREDPPLEFNQQPDPVCGDRSEAELVSPFTCAGTTTLIAEQEVHILELIPFVTNVKMFSEGLCSKM